MFSLALDHLGQCVEPSHYLLLIRDRAGQPTSPANASAGSDTAGSVLASRQGTSDGSNRASDVWRYRVRGAFRAGLRGVTLGSILVTSAGDGPAATAGAVRAV